MELHENLYALGLRLGREVFNDPDSFRGALDDFLDEDSATTGDINLLVDAVRLGAFQSMTTMIDSGAQVTAAVEEAGNRLARDRGSADVAGAQWACAVLGFAIGKVSDAEVRRYRTQHSTPQPPSMPMPPTQFPAQQQPTPPTQQAQQPQPTQQPAPPPAAPTQYPGSGPLPTQQPQQAYNQGPPQSSWPGPGGGGPLPPEPKRKTWPILVATVVAIALIAGGVVALIVTRDGGDDDNGPSDDSSSEKTDDLAVDLDSIQGRYSKLAGDVTADLDDDCEAGDAAEGTSEVVTCPLADGTLELTTYSSKEDLDSARNASTGTDAGTRFSQTDAGVVYGVDSSSAVSEADTSTIYWDSNAGLQSGLFTFSGADDTTTMDDLSSTYMNTQPVVDWPTKPEDDGMTALATEFVNLDKCDRIQTIQDGETEESICTAPKGITVFMGVFKSGADFKAYRRDALQQGADQGYPLRNWNFGGGTREGAAAEYFNSSGDAVRYWDKPECKCYMEANLTGGDLKTLENWWVNA